MQKKNIPILLFLCVFLFFCTPRLCRAKEDFVLNFNNVEIKTFIKFIGDFTQQNYVIDPGVRGNVTIYSNKAVSSDNINRIFKTILNLYGYIVVEKDDISIILPVSEGKAKTKTINVGDVPEDMMEEFIIQVVPIEHYSADTLSQILSPYVTKGGQITVDERTNSLIISDMGENISKIMDIIKKIDRPSPPGKEDLKVYKLENADSENIAKILNQILSKKKRVVRTGRQSRVLIEPSVVAAVETNSLIVHAEPDDFKTIENLIKELDVLTNQVLIEALIAEVSYDKTQELGIEWATSSKLDNDKYTIGGGANFGTIEGYAKTGIAPEGLSVAMYKGELAYPLSVGALLNMYKEDTNFNILSTPQIMTTDNQEASINVSENRPYLTETRFVESSGGSTGDTIKSYDYKDVGIILKITPQISQDKYVRLKISQSVTKVIGGVTSEALITAKREAETTLIVPNNKTVVLGGLIRNDTENSVNKIPFLGDIPGLGIFFRKETEKTVKTNLLIFITPHIISTFQQAEEIKEEKKKIFEGIELKNEG
jgi:general secretion pathway protein D